MSPVAPSAASALGTRAPSASGAPSPSTNWLVACLPAVLALALALLGLSLGLRRGMALVTAATAILVANMVLLAVSYRTRRMFALRVELRKQHHLQACAQGTVLLYWGWYWRPVYEFAPLLAAQLLFAYAFDMLLAWTRRDTYTLGFGPVPVVFSTNLFLWFKPEWFTFQFAMLAVGFAAKELLRWRRDGRLVHVFNPSSFPLALVSLLLIGVGASEATRGQDIAITQFYPPQMYVLLFLVGLPGQFFFGVASMTLAAVLTTYLLGLLYFAATGTYFFYDSYVPIAVFLGMHLLFTDPSTSPRSELGRLIFGALYGASSMVLYQGLGLLGVPAFYDKLLQVPMLNLSVRWLDRASSWPCLRMLDPSRVGRSLAPRVRHLAYMAIWASVFVTLSLVDGLGDGHRGQWLPFWERACREGRPRACAYEANLHQILCDAGSGWACNEEGVRTVADGGSGGTGAGARAARSFERGCRLGFVPACRNQRRGAEDENLLERAPPMLADYRVLVRGSKGPVSEQTPEWLYARACEQGWPDTCRRVGPSQ